MEELLDDTSIEDTGVADTVIYPNTAAMSYSHLSGVGSQKCLRSDVTYTGDCGQIDPSPLTHKTYTHYLSQTHVYVTAAPTLSIQLAQQTSAAAANKVSS